MKSPRVDRRRFLKEITAVAAAVPAISAEAFSPERAGRRHRIDESAQTAAPATKSPGRIRFGVIGLNHGHISGQTNAVLRAGGEFVSVYAKEPELLAPFRKQFPQAKLAKSEGEVLEDSSIQLVLSAGI